MKIYDRKGREFIVDQSQNNFLKLLYSHILGRCMLKLLTLPFITCLGGIYMNSSFSRKRISRFIEKNHICMEQFVKQDYHSYNEFFIRKIKEGQRPIDLRPSVLISPADAKLTYYPILEDTHFYIKETYYTVEELLDNRNLSKEYIGGICLVFRLTVDDYHRYCFIDSGTKEKDHYIPGIFHTVNPIANDYYPIYKQNSRSYSLLHTNNFDDVVMMEVGAMMVGKIVNHPLECFKKGQEKGYFEFGGSTIVLLIKKDIVQIDEDIIRHSSSYDETRVHMGEKIGVKRKELC